MGNNCSCKSCVISCIDNYADCKDYINNEGKYNETPSEIKISASVNIQNILKTITIETELKRNEEKKITQAQAQVQVQTQVVEPSKMELSKESDLSKELIVKKSKKNTEEEFEIL